MLPNQKKKIEKIMKKTLVKAWKYFPYKYRKNIDILRRKYIWKKNNAIFIHIPKAAGVSVNRAIYGKPLGHFYAKDVQKMFPKTFKNIFTFSVVRHPIDRLFSAYTFSKLGKTEFMGMQKPDYYVNHQDFKSFETFVNNWLIRKELTKIDGVFRPQYLYLFDEKGELMVDKFYKLEKIEDYYSEISNKIGKPFIMSHDNRSDKEEIYMEPELKQLIYKLYKKDFELLGYSI